MLALGLITSAVAHETLSKRHHGLERFPVAFYSLLCALTTLSLGLGAVYSWVEWDVAGIFMFTPPTLLVGLSICHALGLRRRAPRPQARVFPIEDYAVVVLGLPVVHVALIEVHEVITGSV